MAINYEALAKTALDQIAGAGRLVDLIYQEQGDYKPQTDTFNNQHANTAVVRAVLSDFQASQIDGTIIRREDKKALVAADGLKYVPSTSDLIIDGEIQYTIVNVETIAPGDVVLVYKLQLRR